MAVPRRDHYAAREHHQPERAGGADACVAPVETARLDDRDARGDSARLVLADGRRRSATQAASVLREQQGATRTEILVPRSRYGSGDAHDDCGYDERSNQVVMAGLHTFLLSVSSA